MVGRRALANRALGMLTLEGVNRHNPIWVGKAYQRFKDANNMTDRLGALSALQARCLAATADSGIGFGAIADALSIE